MKYKKGTKTLLIGGVILTLACLAYEEYSKRENEENLSENESLESLESELKIAVENEDYEKAAVLRDKIKEINI